MLTDHVRARPGDPPSLVTEPTQLEALAGRLLTVPRIAIDTEAASFHRYVDRVYLVQVSTDLETALIDPLAVEDLGPLGECLAAPNLEVVIHDADYDLRILDRDYGFRARNLFDTRLAAQLVGEPSVGLSALLQKYFCVKLDKKLQRADWSVRPLSPAMLRYAAADTQFLPALRDELERQLLSQDRLAWAQEEFRHLETIRWTAPTSDDAAGYLRIRGAKGLREPRARAILRALYLWRDSTARELDRAPFRVLGNDALLSIARHAPRNRSTLAATAAVPASAVRRYGTAILQAVELGLSLPAAELPEIRRPLRPAADPAYDQRLERLKLLRNECAETVGMDPGLLCPNGTLQMLARATPASADELARLAGLRTWQRELLGAEALLAALRGSGSAD